MTDLVDMLRMIANKEFGTYDVGDDSVRVGCQTLRDAAAEIERLRADKESVIHYQVPTSVFWFSDPYQTVEWSAVSDITDWSPSTDTGSTTIASQPWGSPYAMNPENWT
jgi:hypothetical protein